VSTLSPRGMTVASACVYTNEAMTCTD